MPKAKTSIINTAPIVVLRYTPPADEALTLRSDGPGPIATAEDFAAVGALHVACKRMIRRIEEHYARIKQPIQEALTRVRDLERDDKGPYERYVAQAAPRLNQWKREEEARAEAERRRAQAEADARALEQRKAELQVLKQVAKAADTPELRKAFQAEARDLANRPVAAPRVEVAPATPKVAGLAFVRRSGGEVDQLWTFVCAVAAPLMREVELANHGEAPRKEILAFLDSFGSAPLEALEVRPAWLTTKATELGERLGQVFPGLRHVWREGTSGR